MGKLALVLGGGAPNATLMAGALCYMAEQGVEFDIISTAGAGALIGLVYTAHANPNRMTRDEALRNLQNSGVQDLIYNVLPVNYKVFQKSFFGTGLTEQALRLLEFNPFYTRNPTNNFQRLMNDWLTLMVVSWMPTDLSPFSKGVSAPVPFVDELVDFSRLDEPNQSDFYLNAYNIKNRRIESFYNRSADPAKRVTSESFRASEAFPFIYPPVELNGELYFEGAAVDSLNYKVLLGHHPDVEHIVVFDVLGAEPLIRDPRDLWNAYSISIITPLVEVAKDDTKLFQSLYNPIVELSPERQQEIQNAGDYMAQLRKFQEIDRGNAKGDPAYQAGVRRQYNLLRVNFEKNLTDDNWAQALEWSYSNLSQLFQIGYETGGEFYEANKAILSPTDS